MSLSYTDFAESISKSIIDVIKSYYEISNYKVVYNEKVKFKFTIYRYRWWQVCNGLFMACEEFGRYS